MSKKRVPKADPSSSPAAAAADREKYMFDPKKMTNWWSKLNKHLKNSLEKDDGEDCRIKILNYLPGHLKLWVVHCHDLKHWKACQNFLNLLGDHVGSLEVYQQYRELVKNISEFKRLSKNKSIPQSLMARYYFYATEAHELGYVTIFTLFQDLQSFYSKKAYLEQYTRYFDIGGLERPSNSIFPFLDPKSTEVASVMREKWDSLFHGLYSLYCSDLPSPYASRIVTPAKTLLKQGMEYSTDSECDSDSERGTTVAGSQHDDKNDGNRADNNANDESDNSDSDEEAEDDDAPLEDYCIFCGSDDHLADDCQVLDKMIEGGILRKDEKGEGWHDIHGHSIESYYPDFILEGARFQNYLKTFASTVLSESGTDGSASSPSQLPSSAFQQKFAINPFDFMALSPDLCDAIIDQCDAADDFLQRPFDMRQILNHLMDAMLLSKMSSISKVDVSDTISASAITTARDKNSPQRKEPAKSASKTDELAKLAKPATKAEE